ncbi:YktB family protein [Listeria costaricensis]|uniref:YktB family protein n=1 Tax=Listeria costaricensis TaxID=2026604 RepID=UPI001F09D775|nr:DUF1054 domain-containing protein [Listeria costaricensis]
MTAIKGFTQADFDSMEVPGLEARMEKIQTHIQPKFQTLGAALATYLSVQLGTEMHLHIARHARRSVNPPDSTWLAIAPDKRGYKKHPHFQVGLYDDYLFVWLAFIYENEERKKIADRYIGEKEAFARLPEDFRISKDHTVKETYPLHSAELPKALERFRDVKKGEFLIGKIFPAGSREIANGPVLEKEVEAVFSALLDFYKQAIK